VASTTFGLPSKRRRFLGCQAASWSRLLKFHAAIADTRGALTLREASYPACSSISPDGMSIWPRSQRSEHHDVLPLQGDASYYSIPAGGDRSLNAVWTYETPFEAMAQIKDYVAFYPDRVDEIS